MTGAVLFARSRRWLLNLVMILASATLIAVFGAVGYSLNPAGLHLVEVAAQAPLLCALTIQASLSTSMAAKEAGASRNLRRWRLIHVSTLSLVACVICGFAATHSLSASAISPDAASALGPVGIIRNTLALTGAALLCGAVISPAFGWILPLAWAVVPYVALSSREFDSSGVLTLLMQPDSALVPAIVAVSLWALGTLFAVRDPRRSDG